MKTTMFSQDTAHDLHKFYSKWRNANKNEREMLKREAQKLNATYAGADIFLESFISVLVTKLIDLFAETRIPEMTDSEIDEALKKLEAYQIESAR